MFGLTAFPQTISECRRNLLKVFSVIRQKRSEIPKQILTVEGVEEILKGNRSYIFTVLIYLKSFYGSQMAGSSDIEDYLRKEEETRSLPVQIGAKLKEY